MIEFLMLIGMALGLSIAMTGGIYCGIVVGKMICSGLLDE
tara:strand:+ start:306 stop:425 length:120 start_codon:yes stop_codon:yes gene_type:complete